jgi:GT2 family glycosyltransferase
MTAMSETLPPGATVVIATLNRGPFLVRTLCDLIEQSYRPLELLVVDQSSTTSAELQALLDQHPGLISYHRVDFTGLPVARNYGWQKARHENIVFVDDDIRCGAELVEHHLQSLRDPTVGVVAGGVDELSNDRSGMTGGFNPWLASPVGAFGATGEFDVRSAKGCNFSVRKQVLREIGGIDELLNVGAALYEETEFCLRASAAGYRIHFNGRARLLHLAAPEGGCRVREPRRYVRALFHNRSVLIRRHLAAHHRPTALARLLFLSASFARANDDLGVLAAAMRGCIEGLRDGSRKALCSNW